METATLGSVNTDSRLTHVGSHVSGPIQELKPDPPLFVFARNKHTAGWPTSDDVASNM